MTSFKAAAVLGGALVSVAAAVQVPVNLAHEDGNRHDAWIEVASEVAIRYRERPESTITEDVRLSQLASIYFYEPNEFAEGLALFEGGKYPEAQAKFEQCAAAYAPAAPLVGNYATLARFYVMECQRKVGNLAGLAKTLDGFDAEKLVRTSRRSQVELYGLWLAVAQEDWAKVLGSAEEWLARRELPSGQRSQVAYCRGLALEQEGRLSEALHAFSTAMVAGGNRDEVVVRDAALAALRIHLADPLVQQAMKAHGTDEAAPNSAAGLRLREAASLAAMYQTRLSGGRPLPEEFQALVKYKPEPSTPEAPEAEAPAGE